MSCEGISYQKEGKTEPQEKGGLKWLLFLDYTADCG